MQTDNDNGKYTYGIEKFEGTFDKEEIGVAIIPCKTINDINNLEALGLYIYLLGRPSGWKLNVKQLKDHFQCNKDKIYQLLNWLIKETLIICTMVRNQGKFTKPHYRVLLHRQSSRVSGVEITSKPLETLAGIDDSPRLEKPDTVTPDTVNPDTYITENVVNIEKRNNPIVPKGTECAFAIFWSLYPLKKARKQCEVKWKRFNLDEKADQILLALRNQIENDDQWKRGYVPNPLTYINGELWNDEIVQPKRKEKPNQDVVYI